MGCRQSVSGRYPNQRWHNVYSLRPRQNGHHLPDDIFKCIFLNENVGISLKISQKFVPKVPINNTPALVLIMAWRRPGDMPLSEPMMVSLPTHICVTGLNELIGAQVTNFNEFWSKYNIFHSGKLIWRCSLKHAGSFVCSHFVTWCE